MKRRLFLQGSLAGGVAAGVGLCFPGTLLAAWPQDAFEARSVEDVMEELFQGTATADSADIIIEAPDKAQDGAAVRVSVEARMPQVESITIIAEKNPVPLIASFHMGAKSVPYVQTIIKMGEDSNVIAVVKAGGKLYTSRKMVEVVAGGCAAP